VVSAKRWGVVKTARKLNVSESMPHSVFDQDLNFEGFRQNGDFSGT